MQFQGPVLVILHGDTGAGAAERMVGGACVAAGLNTAATALAAGFEAVIIATDEPEAFPRVPAGVLVDADEPGELYDFHGRLASIVRRYGLARPAVMGSGSVPLLGVEDFRFITEQLAARDGRFVTNNFFSADLTAWTPGSAIERVSDLGRDNLLPRRLRDQAGLALVPMPRTTATQFDLDTPIDLAVLAACEQTPPGLRAAAGAVPAETVARVRAVMPLVCDRTAELVIAGRVGSQAWQHYERETACRIRLFSEERGLAVAGPGHVPHSVLGFLLEEVGAERFFQRLALLGDAIILDTRVIEAHLGLHLSREDRFQGDLLAAEAIADPVWRGFVAAARECPRPVLLGGHSLVSGALMALNDQAWLENDRRVAGT